MRLCELLEYNQIVIQCHDNPDADAIASGFGVYTYLKEAGKDVRFIYSGKYRIQKSNLVLMVDELLIPIEYVETLPKVELLVTVDCQYGQGNVTKFECEHCAVIDHHQISGKLPEMNEVRSALGSCSTVVRELLEAEGFDMNERPKLATALYYGLLTDTNNFTEIEHPSDKDLRDDARFNRACIVRFRNANLSLKELEIAGEALIGYDYDENYRFAVVEAKPCDPNILGVISDLILEVDAVDTSLVYSVLPFGVKISVRSCIKEVKASELAEFITAGIGSGGGHLEKAGGFIQMELLTQAYDEYCNQFHLPIQHEEEKEGTITRPVLKGINGFLKWRMVDYFDDVEIIRAKEYVFHPEEMRLYKKRQLQCGYVVASDIFEIGTKVCVRTLEGDLNIEIAEDTYIMLGIQGELYPSTRQKFEAGYERCERPYEYPGEYAPTIKHVLEGKNVSVISYAKSCVTKDEVCIYAKPLDHRVKIFTVWDKDKYMLGKEGDFLAVRRDDHKDVYIIEKNIFYQSYVTVSE